MNDFITLNNKRLLSEFKTQPRYVPPREEKKSEKESDKKIKQVRVSDKAKEFLMAVNLYQYKKTQTEITTLASFSLGTGSRIATECVKKNLVKILQVKFGKGSPKYPILLPDAYKIIGINEKSFYGKGAGYEHVLYQHLISEHFSEYKPVIELFRNGKSIDVGIDTNELFVCFEVAMTSTHEKENIEKDLDKALADVVITACKNEKVMGEVQDIVLDLSEQMKNKTKVCLMSELLNGKLDELIKSINS